MPTIVFETLHDTVAIMFLSLRCEKEIWAHLVTSYLWCCFGKFANRFHPTKLPVSIITNEYRRHAHIVVGWFSLRRHRQVRNITTTLEHLKHSSSVNAWVYMPWSPVVCSVCFSFQLYTKGPGWTSSSLSFRISIILWSVWWLTLINTSSLTLQAEDHPYTFSCNVTWADSTNASKKTPPPPLLLFF